MTRSLHGHHDFGAFGDLSLLQSTPQLIGSSDFRRLFRFTLKQKRSGPDGVPFDDLIIVQGQGRPHGIDNDRCPDAQAG